ncbi:hypothetical protein EHP00_289 [Ecytonucleospora hepatopenaei]|uniref:Uncharacterized protein n=1 Tax=Ecytonucleospora hepatopenaei TaxID=646526 RepID=A0A1W0E7I0_9MICR|nr:hypothetical protein EHP00_289 [Ecytonucleospora hepatopenaei]
MYFHQQYNPNRENDDFEPTRCRKKGLNFAIPEDSNENTTFGNVFYVENREKNNFWENDCNKDILNINYEKEYTKIRENSFTNNPAIKYSKLNRLTKMYLNDNKRSVKNKKITTRMQNHKK